MSPQFTTISTPFFLNSSSAARTRAQLSIVVPTCVSVTSPTRATRPLAGTPKSGTVPAAAIPPMNCLLLICIILLLCIR